MPPKPPEILEVDTQRVAEIVGRVRARQLLSLEEGAVMDRREVLSKLVEILYERNDIDFHRGTFRVRGDVIDIFPVHEEERIPVRQQVHDSLQIDRTRFAFGHGHSNPLAYRLQAPASSLSL